METIYVNKYATNQSVNSCSTTLTDDILPFLATRLAQYSNLTYDGLASESTALREAVFSIGSNTLYKFAIGNPVNTNNVNIDIGVSLRDASIPLTQVANKHLGANLLVPSGRLSWVQGNSKQYSYYLYMISDTSGNLEVIWTPNPSYGNTLYSQPMVFVKTATGRDAVVIFTSGDYPLDVFFLDDSSHTNYFLSQSSIQYSSVNNVFKSNNIPVTATAGGTSVVDVINTKLVYIFNSALDSTFVSGQVNNNTGSIRKLIKIGNTYYRQLSSNWWFEDPKGDEEIEIHDDTQPSS